MNLFIAALSALIVGAVGALCLARSSRWASNVGALGTLVGAAFGAVGSFQALWAEKVEQLSLPWSVPGGSFSLGIDPLSAFFLVPLFVLSAVTALYGRTYLLEHAPTRLLALPWAFFNVFVASIALVVLARNSVLFLTAWETMSVAGYLLVTFEHQDTAVRRAGWVYLVATHVGVAALMALFLLLRHFTGSFEFSAVAASALSEPASATLFLLAVVGFGAKAGLVPLHVWLPEAHAAAPSHVSALMSGVLIKMGIYGILRVTLLVGHPQPFWGPLLMVLGLLGGALGIALALVQRDLKRALAYSSIENVGLVTVGIGIGFWGLSSQRPLLALIGFAGGLMHVWNHAAMKGLMFLSAGSILLGAHTKDLEKLGGLMRRMPWTGSTMFVGAIAISGLPPLNGFVSEWLLYRGLLQGAMEAEASSGTAFFVAVAVLSMIGAMAALCFVRLIGTALLGEPRSQQAAHAHESSVLIRLPLVALVIAILGLALVPGLLETPLRSVVTQLAGSPVAQGSATTLALDRLGLLNLALLAGLVLAGGLSLLFFRPGRITSDATWGCGYLEPTPRMQYTARSFGEFFTTHLLPRVLSPRSTVQTPNGLFPNHGSLSVDMADPLMLRTYEPFFARWADRFARLRWMQQGMLHVYIVYILLALLLGLACSATSSWLAQGESIFPPSRSRLAESCGPHRQPHSANRFHSTVESIA